MDEIIRRIYPVYGRPESERPEYRVQDTPVLEEGDRGWSSQRSHHPVNSGPSLLKVKIKLNLDTYSAAICHLSKDATVDYDGLLHFGLIGSRVSTGTD